MLSQRVKRAPFGAVGQHVYLSGGARGTLFHVSVYHEHCWSVPRLDLTYLLSCSQDSVIEYAAKFVATYSPCQR
jgi:hypothetical protein